MMEASELIERLEKATAPDRNLDAALHVALVRPEQRADDLRYFRVPSANMDHMEMCAPGTYWLKERSGASLQTAPAYTASLDAALALVERSGWRLYTIDASIRGRLSVMLASLEPQPLTDGEGREYMGTAYNYATHDGLALALCLALLRASPTEEPALPPQAEAVKE